MTETKTKTKRGRPPPLVPFKRHNIYLPDHIWQRLGKKHSQTIINLVLQSSPPPTPETKTTKTPDR